MDFSPAPQRSRIDVEIEPFTCQQKAIVLRCIRRAYESGCKSRPAAAHGESKVRRVRSTWADIQTQAHHCKIGLLLSGRYDVTEDRFLIIAKGRRRRDTDHTWQRLNRALDRGPLPVDEWRDAILAAYARSDAATAMELQAMLDVASLGAELLDLSDDLASLTCSEQRQAAEKGRDYLSGKLGRHRGAGPVAYALHSYRSFLTETYEVLSGMGASRGVTYSATSAEKSGRPSSAAIRFLTAGTSFIPGLSASKNSEWLKAHWLSKGKYTTTR